MSVLRNTAPVRDHVLPLIRLKVRPDQTDLVSPNAVTLAQAAYERGSHVWGLWTGETPVGLMAMIHPGEYNWPAHDPQPGPDRQAAYLWRLMIAADHQGQGHGRAALQMAFAQARAWGCPRITAHVLDAPHSNLPFYQHHGFRLTGIVDGPEVEIVADL